MGFLARPDRLDRRAAMSPCRRVHVRFILNATVCSACVRVCSVATSTCVTYERWLWLQVLNEHAHRARIPTTTHPSRKPPPLALSPTRSTLECIANTYSMAMRAFLRVCVCLCVCRPLYQNANTHTHTHAYILSVYIHKFRQLFKCICRESGLPLNMHIT